MELVELRAESAKTYDLGGNKRQLVVSVGAIHYRDNYADLREQWKDIDLTWEDNKITRAPYELTLQGKKLTIRNKKSGEVSIIELTEIGGKPIKSPPDIAWEKSRGLARAPGIIPLDNVALDTDLEIVAGSNQIKFTRVLKSDKAPLDAKFKITGNFSIRASDADGELPVETSLVGDILTETLKPDRPIKYPVRVDPTLTIQPSGKDTYAHLYGTPNTNYGSGTTLRLSAATNDYTRIFLEFLLTALPADATVISAALSLYYYAIVWNNAVGRTYWANRLTRVDWVELEATWNIYKTGSNWTTAGGDFTATNAASAVVPAAYSWMAWNILAQVQYAQTNVVAVELLVKDGTESGAAGWGVQFYSNNYTTDLTLRPKLVIDYTVPFKRGWWSK